jgi:hypothetical protein
LISTELGCCERPKYFFKPNELRNINGTIKTDISKSVVNDLSKYTSEEEQQANKEMWESSFMTINPNRSNGWFKPNAGLYMGKVKDLQKMYYLMNIQVSEDDQTILSEIILQNKGMFVLDYNAEIFSNSFAWDPKSEEICGGCYYKKNKRNEITNQMFRTTPYFLHFPGKHFKCYDTVYDLLPGIMPVRIPIDQDPDNITS